MTIDDPAAPPDGGGWIDPWDVRRAVGTEGRLRAFNDALVLSAGDIHIARRLGAVTGEADERVLLAAALAARGPRLGHICVDLATAAATTLSDRERPGDSDEAFDIASLPWPALDQWVDALAASPLVAVGSGVGGVHRPLRLDGTLLYLDRYWRQERQVAADLIARTDGAPAAVASSFAHTAGSAPTTAGSAPTTAGSAPTTAGSAPTTARSAHTTAGSAPTTAGSASAAATPATTDGAAAVDRALLAAGLDRLFGAEAPDLQRLAAAVAVLRRFAVIAGGPGTGKTTTVARVLALLGEQRAAAGRPPPKVALAAPTGKAAARLQESVHAEARGLDVVAEHRAWLLGLRASTIHRLLGWRPDSASRFRHDRSNRLPFDVVVIDETSMVSLSLMAKLVEAVRPDARLVLVGDPDQLSSVEAGAVLGDLVGPAARSLRMTGRARSEAMAATGQEVPATDPPPDVTVGDGIVVLRRVHRFGGGIAAIATAIQRGDADGTVSALRHHPEAVRWIDGDSLEPVRSAVVDAGRTVVAAARAGDGRTALRALGSVRILCAHRLGPRGVAAWIAEAERWLAGAIDDYGTGGRWYPGRPLLVTQNDYSLGLYNGDVGVIVRTADGRPAAAFERQGEIVLLSPSRLDSVETVHAMTIHKSQGSQFDTVAVVLPDPAARILTRELLYTAVTRAQRQVLLIGGEASVRAAVDRPVARASGLRTRLWGPD